jgi:hypothetical protein
VGTVVLSIEGKLPFTYFREELFPYISGGDEHQKQNAVNRRFFLRDHSLSVDLRYPDGSFNRRILRANRGTVKWSDEPRQRFLPHGGVSSAYESRTLPDGLIYVRYALCEDRYEKELSTLIKSISGSWPRAIVIDVRGNPGGNTPHNLIGHLISTPVEAGIRKTRCSISDLDAQLKPILERDGLTPALTNALNAAIKAGQLPKGYSPGWITSERSIEPDAVHYDGPLYLIVDSGTASAAEDFAAILKGCGRAEVIGTPTVGSTGNSIRFSLPAGGSVRICVAQARFANGEDFIPMGVLPDILLHRTIEGIIDNRDELLESALDFVREQLQ